MAGPAAAGIRWRSCLTPPAGPHHWGRAAARQSLAAFCRRQTQTSCCSSCACPPQHCRCCDPPTPHQTALLARCFWVSAGTCRKSCQTCCACCPAAQRRLPRHAPARWQLGGSRHAALLGCWVGRGWCCPAQLPQPQPQHRRQRPALLPQLLHRRCRRQPQLPPAAVSQRWVPDRCRCCGCGSCRLAERRHS